MTNLLRVMFLLLLICACLAALERVLAEGERPTTWDADAAVIAERLRPILDAELHLVDTICELTEDDRRHLRLAAEARLHRLAKERGDPADHAANGLVTVRWGNDNVSPPFANLAAHLAPTISAHLPRAQAARYDEEITKRFEFRKRAAMQAIIANIDSTLILSAEQRGNLASELASRWNKDWECNSLSPSPSSHELPIDELFPQGAGEVATRYLTTAQQQYLRDYLTREPADRFASIATTGQQIPSWATGEALRNDAGSREKRSE